ncbi:hypothetical protein ABL78_2928 [Leptomonas seymouri]|uniref:Uncharacterized protein n=1 Tax=Leptomonas seymouri TaxID=5684 RepID=A0A0N1I5K2_LEPSE|nr:hypothetical protein ABL78_2928 [Leptomonas seymouri]|eukprot:KPI87992.1 hypothetical protein ABL78_2928 [Leptomonas seymouri]
MEDHRRFSAAPVNFDRFVSLNRANSRSLSPDDELHQMLRPYQSRPTAASMNGHRKALTTLSSSPSHAHKAERRSTDVLNATAASAVVIEGPSTQAATPPSRSVSGGAATTSTGTSMEVGGPAETRGGPHYHYVEDETVELERSQPAVEEVDMLLRAVQQLGSPLYNPVTRQFMCWNSHVLERRSRASYGDIEGVSCDFCGHTDWLDALVEGESGNEHHADDTDALSGVKKEESETKGGKTALSAHRRYLYRCPICEVDICCACLDEVRADERLHVPCLQCQRCGACETRRNAPLHRCRGPTGLKEETDPAEGPSWAPAPKEETPAISRCVQPPSPPVETTAPKVLAGLATVRSHVRLGLSRRRDSHCAATATRATRETAAVMRKEHSTTTLRAVQPVPSSPSTSSILAAPTLPTRKRAYTPRSTVAASAKTRAKPDEPTESDEGDDLPVEVVQQAPPALPRPQQRQRFQGALPSRESRARAPDSYARGSPASEQALLLQQQKSSVLSTARYEVHIAPQSSEEVEEVRRISREQHLLLIPAPSVGGVSLAYFPTRLAAESCVDRATVSSIEAILKRYVCES